MTSIERDPNRQDGELGDFEPPGIGANNSPDDLLAEYATRSELSKELKIGERTLANYDAMGEGPPRRLLAGRWLYHRGLARKWLAAGLTTEPQQ